MPQGPPFGSGPPWAPGGIPPQGVPPAPPPIAAPWVPTQFPYVANAGLVASGGNSTSMTFAVSANAGDGLLLYVAPSGTSALSATANSGDTFNLFPSTFAAFNAQIYALWCPVISGKNPSVTLLSGTSRTISVAWFQVVGGNRSGFWVDGISGSHTAGATSLNPGLQTVSSSDLIIAAAITSNTALGTWAGGYTRVGSLQTTAGTGNVVELNCAYSNVPQPSGTLSPTYTTAGGAFQIGSLAVAIRSAATYPDNIPVKLSLPIYPPWMKVVVPFPEGTPDPDVSLILYGQTATFTEGTIPPEVDYFPTAQTATFTEGTITPQTGDVTLTISGLSGAFSEGTITISGQDVTTTQAGGTGSSRRRKIKRASEIFAEEMAKLEKQATEATAQRHEVESKLSELPTDPGRVSADMLRYIVDFERALRRAQAKEKLENETIPEVPVYIRVPRKSAGVRRIEAYQRLKVLSGIARHREQVAQERLRKVREKIDVDAATYFMNFIMWDD